MSGGKIKNNCIVFTRFFKSVYQFEKRSLKNIYNICFQERDQVSADTWLLAIYYTVTMF